MCTVHTEVLCSMLASCLVHGAWIQCASHTKRGKEDQVVFICSIQSLFVLRLVYHVSCMALISLAESNHHGLALKAHRRRATSPSQFEREDGSTSALYTCEDTVHTNVRQARSCLSVRKVRP